MPLSLRVGPDEVLVQPVTGWEVAASEATGVVFLALEYMDHPGQPKSGERGQLQATLSPQQAMEIAANLIRAAGKLPEPPARPPERPVQLASPWRAGASQVLTPKCCIWDYPASQPETACVRVRTD